jgi:hypothetical protein
MPSDIPGFYYDPIQKRYYRISSQSSNSTPSARAINDRALHEQRIVKQLDSLNSSSTKTSQQSRGRKKFVHSRSWLLLQRQYGQLSIGNIDYNDE